MLADKHLSTQSQASQPRLLQRDIFCLGWGWTAKKTGGRRFEEGRGYCAYSSYVAFKGVMKGKQAIIKVVSFYKSVAIVFPVLKTCSGHPAEASVTLSKRVSYFLG